MSPVFGNVAPHAGQSHAARPRHRPTRPAGVFVVESLDRRLFAGGAVAALGADVLVAGPTTVVDELNGNGPAQYADVLPPSPRPAMPAPALDLSDLPPLAGLLAAHSIADTESPRQASAAPSASGATPTGKKGGGTTLLSGDTCLTFTLFLTVGFQGTADEEYPDQPNTFTFTASPDCGAYGAPTSVTISYTVGGTATEGQNGDYTGISSGSVTVPLDQYGHGSQSISFYTVDDALVEDFETVEVTMTEAQLNNPPPNWSYEIPPPGSAYASIRDNEPGVSIATTDDTAVEGRIDPATGEKDFIEFTITRTKSYRHSINVNYSIEPSSTAKEGSLESGGDFGPLYGQIAMAAGEQSTTLRVVPHDDALQELEEFFYLRLQPGDGYRVNLYADIGFGKIPDPDVLAILISGHTQNGSHDNPPGPVSAPSRNAGILKLEPLLIKAGVHKANIRKFAEDPNNTETEPFDISTIDTQHCGDTLPTIIQTIRREIEDVERRSLGKKLNLVLIGYSHGGGLVHDVAKSLAVDADTADIRDKYVLIFTGYIDAVKNGGIGAETTLPPRTRYHVNWYQSVTPLKVGEPEGDATSGDGANGAIIFNEDLDKLPEGNGFKEAEIETHWGIDDDPMVTDYRATPARRVSLYSWLIEHFTKKLNSPG